MCGRYTLATPADLIMEHFDLPEVPEIETRFNIAPTQEALIIGARRDGHRAAGLALWGLTTPSGAAAKRPLINARIETVDQKPSFREAFSRRRCLVPADGFYEWRTDSHGKTPHYFSLRDRRLFAFAGIWNQPVADSELVTFAILTTEPNQIVGPVHRRMPVILSDEHYDLWLAKRELSKLEAETFATPFAQARMESREVSPLVNSPANDTAACIQPVLDS
jgi:putative SOS response-associated peptidase YedK